MSYSDTLIYQTVIILGKLFFFPKPDFQLTEDMEHDFSELYETSSRNDHALISYESKYPKWQFLQYIVDTYKVILHGSNNMEISTLEPRKQTDFNGNMVNAVFGTHDSIWSLFFATLNLRVYRGSLRNACWVIQKKNEKEHRFYFFSLNTESNGAEVWTDGVIYILPPTSFSPASKGIVRFDEWLSYTGVTPYAKLHVTPEDFPLIRKVANHDEQESMLKSWFMYKRRAKRSG